MSNAAKKTQPEDTNKLATAAIAQHPLSTPRKKGLTSLQKASAIVAGAALFCLGIITLGGNDKRVSSAVPSMSASHAKKDAAFPTSVDDFVLTGAKRITGKETLNDLKDLFGSANVFDADWSHNDETHDFDGHGSVIYPFAEYDSPEKPTAIVTWQDAAKTSIQSLSLVGKFHYWPHNNDFAHEYWTPLASGWKTRRGMTLEMSIGDLAKLNGKPVSFIGFRGENAGLVTSFNGGKLEDSQGEAHLVVRLRKRIDDHRLDLDRVFTSSEKVTNIDIAVTELTMLYNQPHTAADLVKLARATEALSKASQKVQAVLNQAQPNQPIIQSCLLAGLSRPNATWCVNYDDLQGCAVAMSSIPDDAERALQIQQTIERDLKEKFSGSADLMISGLKRSCANVAQSATPVQPKSEEGHGLPSGLKMPKEPPPDDAVWAD